MDANGKSKNNITAEASVGRAPAGKAKLRAALPLRFDCFFSNAYTLSLRFVLEQFAFNWADPVALSRRH